MPTRARAQRPLWLCALLALLSCLLSPPTTAGAGGPPSIADCLQRFKRACLTPAQVRAYYGVDALAQSSITGKGRTIAIVEAFGSPTLRADLHAFDIAFGLPDPLLTVLAPLGSYQPRNSGWDVETTLDVEWAHAIAPDARILVLQSPVNETEGVQGLPQFLALERYALDRRLADVISQSWGATEDTLLDKAGLQMIARFHAFFADAAARGVTVVAASGDVGAAGIDLSLKHVFTHPAVGYPAADPLVLAVGGTSLAVTLTGKASHEMGWRLSGGGISRRFAEPAYQLALTAATQRMLHGHRGLPDVSYNAAAESSVLVYFRGAWRPVAGTSAAAPQWAGLVALADELAGRDLGFVNPALYHLACSSRYSIDFRDIVLGQSVGPIKQGAGLGGLGYRTAPGWDAVTGLGSPSAATLVPDLAHFASTSVGGAFEAVGACAAL